MPTSSNSTITQLLQRADLFFAFALFGTVMLLVLPVPPFLLDVLIALNFGVSILVLLAIIYVKDPPEFSGFPTMLLSLTLFRLALNISSTRQILVHGYAGEIINSFGHFAIQGNYIVGVVVFVILVVINFVVITKGAGSIAEVSARFTLDALPGKQMAIDAELNAGIIDDVTATERRVKIQKEADFYGAMDGASKFVRGDAVAGIMIMLVNIFGGFAIGVFQMDLSLNESIQKFTLLSIGDGLVSQIPALIISVGAGVLVTRASGSTNLGAQIAGQLFRYPKALGIAAAVLALFGIMPGMPIVPFFMLAALAGFLARTFKSPPEAQASGGAPSLGTRSKGGRGAKGAGAAPATAPRDCFRRRAQADRGRRLHDRDRPRAPEPRRREDRGRPPGPRDRGAQDDRPREGDRGPAHLGARQSGARVERLPVPAAGQADRARPAHVRALAGDERLRKHREACGGSDEGAGLQPRRNLDRRRRKEERRAERVHGRRRLLGAHHASVRVAQGATRTCSSAARTSSRSSTTSRRPIRRS